MTNYLKSGINSLSFTTALNKANQGEITMLLSKNPNFIALLNTMNVATRIEDLCKETNFRNAKVKHYCDEYSICTEYISSVDQLNKHIVISNRIFFSKENVFYILFSRGRCDSPLSIIFKKENDNWSISFIKYTKEDDSSYNEEQNVISEKIRKIINIVPVHHEITTIQETEAWAYIKSCLALANDFDRELRQND